MGFIRENFALLDGVFADNNEMALMSFDNATSDIDHKERYILNTLHNPWSTPADTLKMSLAESSSL